MFTDNDLRLMEEEGMEYVVSAKLKSLPKKNQSGDFKRGFQACPGGR